MVACSYGISLLVLYSISHSLAALIHKMPSSTLQAFLNNFAKCVPTIPELGTVHLWGSGEAGGIWGGPSQKNKGKGEARDIF